MLGYQGILQYEKLRTTAISRLRQRRDRGDISLHVPTADDAFHDGSVVLPEVLSWFNYIHHSLRRSDFVSGRVLDLVEETMLLKGPDQRLKSPQLCSRLDDILVLAERDLQKQSDIGKVEPITPIILDILKNDVSITPSSSLAATQTAPQIATQGSVPSDQPRLLSAPSSWERKRIGKSERLEKRAPLKTGHRAVQHSQALPRLSKRSTGTSSTSNPALPDKAPWSESPTEGAKPIQTNSIGIDIPSLADKQPALSVGYKSSTQPMRERPELTREPSEAKRKPSEPVREPSKSMREPSEPTVIISEPERVETPKKIDSGSSTPSVNTPVKQRTYEDKEAAFVPLDSGSPKGTTSPAIKWPIIGPNGFDNLLVLQEMYPQLGIFQMRKDSGRSRTLPRLWKAKPDEFLKKFIKDRDIVSHPEKEEYRR